MGYTTRVASLDDVATVAKIVNDAFMGTEGGGWTDVSKIFTGTRTSEAALTKEMKEGLVILVAETQNGAETVIEGCVSLIFISKEEVEIGMLSVPPRKQGKGIGRLLMNASIAYAKDVMHAQSCCVCVVACRKDLLKWYSGMDFIDSGEDYDFDGTPLGLHSVEPGLTQEELIGLRTVRTTWHIPSNTPHKILSIIIAIQACT